MQIEAYQNKANLCVTNIAKVTADSEAKKVVELCDKDGTRKHLHQS